MIFKIFSVFDEKAAAYLPPFYLPTTPMAVRSFADCVNDPGHAFGKHPQDFTLFELGSFDDSSAEFRELDKHPLHNGLEVIVSFIDEEQGKLALEAVSNA